MYTRSGKLLAAASAWAVVAAWPVLAQAAPVTLPGALSPQSSVAPAAPALPQPAAPAQRGQFFHHHALAGLAQA